MKPHYLTTLAACAFLALADTNTNPNQKGEQNAL